MRNWTLLTISIILILGVFRIGFPSVADELSLQQVISAVNFASNSIERAELRANLYISPRPIPKLLQEQMEVDLQQIKIRYQISSNPVEKHILAQHIEYYKDLLHSPPLPRYYEYTVIYRRNEFSDESGVKKRLKSHFSYRIIRVKTGSKHADPQFLKSIPQVVRDIFAGQEIQTQISNGESKVILTVSDQLHNTAYFDEPSVGISILLFRGASTVIPVNPERIIDFQHVTHNGTTLYTIEYTYDISRLALARANKFRSTRIQVNPSIGFSVAKKEHFLNIGGKKVLKSSTRFGEFKLYSQGIWYPTSIQYTEYKEDQEVVEHLFEIHEADFNISIPHDFFHVKENEIRRLGIEISSNSPQLIP